ncbi:nuclear transport factor 2 family protein [Pendulispora rubella]|uniref:Nuclear transport factor 2 family protein n=1 Tax=Pendulispora rubella TaxID=2741070 RepID=A0ABZ2L2Z3_9BACT
MDILRTSVAAAAVWATSSVMAPAHAATPAEQAVLAPFRAVLDGIGKRDKALVRAQLLPGGTTTFIRNGQVVQHTFDAFVEKLPSTGTSRIEERIYDPLVRIDDDIAVIWAAYDFLIDGKVDHCGTDIATLVRRDGRWLISTISDNSRKTCPARPTP